MIVSLGYSRPASPKAMLARLSHLQHGPSLRRRHRCMPSIYPPKERGAVSDGEGVPKLWRVRGRTGRLGPHFFRKILKLIFLCAVVRLVTSGWGVAKTLGRWGVGPVVLVHTQKIGIKYRKPPRGV